MHQERLENIRAQFTAMALDEPEFSHAGRWLKLVDYEPLMALLAEHLAQASTKHDPVAYVSAIVQGRATGRPRPVAAPAISPERMAGYAEIEAKAEAEDLERRKAVGA